MLATLGLAGLALASTTYADYVQGFETDTSGWFAYLNGNVNRVVSGNNGITSFAGGYHATVNAGAEFTGAYTQFGTDGSGTVFPSGGFQTSLAIYLDVANTSYHAANDTRFDWDVALNTSSGGFLRDFVFNAGFYNNTDATGSGNRFVITASNNAGRENSYPENPGRNPLTISSSGWYIFTDDFKMVSGALQDVLTVEDAPNNIIGTWILSDPSDTSPGGVAYGWFSQQEFPNLAIDQTTLSLNEAPVPEPTTIIAGALLLLPFGASTLRILRKTRKV